MVILYYNNVSVIIYFQSREIEFFFFLNTHVKNFEKFDWKNSSIWRKEGSLYPAFILYNSQYVVFLFC